TLNLEQLLGEFAGRIGSIMQAHHVSLLLYGRERADPWAVAQWNPHLDNQDEKGHATVYVDPDGDITMAVTTKMVAMPTLKSSASAKRGASRATKLAQPISGQRVANPAHALPHKHSMRQPRIPRSALRDIDLSLARMAIQHQKIVYGEDIAQIY